VGAISHTSAGMADIESREDELFLKSGDVERPAFVNHGYLKRRTFISSYLVWMINAALAVTVLVLFWDRNYGQVTRHYRDQEIYCMSMTPKLMMRRD
jgi:hypothetical protein